MSMFEVSVSVFGAEFEGSIHFIGKISYEGSTCGCLFLQYVVSIPAEDSFLQGYLMRPTWVASDKPSNLRVLEVQW